MHHIKVSIAAVQALILLLVLTACHKKIVHTPEKLPLSERSSLIIDGQQNLSDAVLELMRLTNLATSSAQLADAIALTQSHWLRPRSFERAQLGESHKNSLPVMMKYFDDLGLRERVMPKSNTYEYVILLGAMYDTFRLRLEYLQALVDQGLQFKKLVLLGSHRPLEKRYESGPMSKAYVFPTLPMTEIDMMNALLDQSSLKKSVNDKNIIRVASTMKTESNGHMSRANTLDTVQDFLKMNTSPNAALVISSQPYIVRQDLVMKSVLMAPWHIETVGPSSPKDLPTDVYLDELARIMYEMRNYLH